MSFSEKASERFRRLKRFMFRRGYMPDSDCRDAFDRVKGQFEAITRDEIKRHPPPPHATILGGPPKSEHDKWQAAFRKELDARFIAMMKEEFEAQWVRIIDRRASDWFYSGVLGVLVGFALGKLF